MASAAELIFYLEDKSISLPGLDLDTILEKLSKKNLEKYKAQFLSKEQVKEYLATMKEQMRDIVKRNIAIIKSAFVQIKDILKGIGETVKNILSNIAVPSTIPTSGGSANPAWVLLDTKQKVQFLKGIILQVKTVMITLLIACEVIDYDIPEVIANIVKGIGVSSDLINTLPI